MREEAAGTASDARTPRAAQRPGTARTRAAAHRMPPRTAPPRRGQTANLACHTTEQRGALAATAGPPLDAGARLPRSDPDPRSPIPIPRPRAPCPVGRAGGSRVAARRRGALKGRASRAARRRRRARATADPRRAPLLDWRPCPWRCRPGGTLLCCCPPCAPNHTRGFFRKVTASLQGCPKRKLTFKLGGSKLTFGSSLVQGRKRVCMRLLRAPWGHIPYNVN
jgi:hypothetical protein